MEHLRFNVRFASLGIKYIHLTRPIMNINHHRFRARGRAVHRILRVWVAIKRILSIGVVNRMCGYVGIRES
jgi:hypothetical protein